MDPEEVARRMHDAYESLAPAFGYETRPESRVPWAELPLMNRALMIAAVDEAIEPLQGRLDAAYLERNQVVAALARVFPAGIARTAIEGWSEDWHGCVYIDLPTGQVSWHYHDSQAHLFEGLPPYAKPWDGHGTPEKYRRLAAINALREE